MKRKLLFLNAMLVAALLYAGWQFHSQWADAKAREAAVLNQKVKAAPAPPFTPLPEAPPVMPSGYADIAQKTLFDKSRNPTVIIEVAPPPPPKPMPALPSYHGMMNLGDGPAAIMSVSPTAAHQEIHPGEPIGQFKLLDVNTQEITLEWDGKVIRRKVEEVMSAALPGAGASARPAASAAAPPPAPVQQIAAGPGADVGKGMKACVPNDSTPAGAVVDGLRKTLYPTPFGDACRWEPAR